VDGFQTFDDDIGKEEDLEKDILDIRHLLDEDSTTEEEPKC
jgi:hypothetical protein